MSIHDGEHDTDWDGLTPQGDAVGDSPVRDTRLGDLLDASLGRVDPRDPGLFLHSLDQIRGGGNGIPRAATEDLPLEGQGQPDSARYHPRSPTQSPEDDHSPSVRRRHPGNGARQRMGMMLASAGMLGMAAMVSMMLIQWPGNTGISERQISDAAGDSRFAPQKVSTVLTGEPPPGSPSPVAALAATEADLGLKSTSNEIAATPAQAPSAPSPVVSESIVPAPAEIPVTQSRTFAASDMEAFADQPSLSRDSEEVRVPSRRQLAAGAGAPRFRPASAPSGSAHNYESDLRVDANEIRLEAAPAAASMSAQSPGMDGPPAPPGVARGGRTLGSARFVPITRARERSAADQATTGTAVTRLAGSTTTTLSLTDDHQTTTPAASSAETDEPRLQQ